MSDQNNISSELSPRPLTKTVDYESSKVVFSGLCLVVGGVVAIAVILARAWFITPASGYWNEFACTVTHSKVVSPQRFNGRLHRAAIGLRYHDGSRTYTGEVSSLSVIRATGPESNGGYVSDRSKQQRIVDSHPVGLQRTCFVDPENRGNIVFEFEAPTPWYWALGGLVMMLLGGFIVVTELNLWWRFGLGERPLRYRPTDNSSVGPVNFKKLTPQGNEIKLGLDEGRPALGDTVKLDWELLDDDKDLEVVSVVLEGKEKVVPPEPSKWELTRPVTDVEHIFASVRQVLPTSTTSSRVGSVDIPIPHDLMHSFESEHHKVEWAIKFFTRHAKSRETCVLCPLTVRIGWTTKIGERSRAWLWD